MEIHIRKAAFEDLKHVLHHRRAMFDEMGFRETPVLDRAEELSREYLREALRIGTYRGWLAEGSDGEIVGGGGIVIAAWPGYPSEDRAARAWILNMYTEPGARRCGVAKRLLEVMVEWCRPKMKLDPKASDTVRSSWRLLKCIPSSFREDRESV